MTTVSTEEKRRKGRIYYYQKQGLSEAQIAERMARFDAKKPNAPDENKQLTPEQARAKELRKQQYLREKQAKAEEKGYPLPLDKCPVCGGEFFKRREGKMIPMRLSRCDDCGVRFFISGRVPDNLRTV